MSIGKKLFFIWIITMFFITFTCALTFLVAQQSLRLGADSLPAQLAKDTAIQLQKGRNAQDSIPPQKVDASKSYDGFVMIYDKNKNLVATSGMFDTKKPAYPKGALDYVSKKGENRITWQPQNGLRFATVAIKSNNYYIVGARSLHETEIIINKITQIVFYAWLACLIFSAAAILVIYAFIKKVYKHQK
ncbi:hypothetical protein [Bacillus methanolicus]|uniref:Putative membrane protein n=1 Tax=Bacillus methanolicus (strain MGA3 / ATCC 53907) TaxID=796606 RepID=I3DUB8_BACMM|nr:hypothetical protein [Bacillus methanolicus]AIE61275.1 putative membrane protein [Bacillus methanolicus MGA3]EIJ77839.1 hypothetical protein MGA3_15851 [Bacillus methanolicus MGA3]